MTEKDKQEAKEATVGLAAAKEISMHTSVAAVWSQLDAVFRLKEQRNAVKAFFYGKNILFSQKNTLHHRAACHRAGTCSYYGSLHQ